MITPNKSPQQAPPPPHQGLADKPPIPPRGAPPQVPQRQSSYENMNVQLRQKSINGNGK